MTDTTDQAQTDVTESLSDYEKWCLQEFHEDFTDAQIARWAKMAGDGPYLSLPSATPITYRVLQVSSKIHVRRGASPADLVAEMTRILPVAGERALQNGYPTFVSVVHSCTRLGEEARRDCDGRVFCEYTATWSE